MQWNPLVPELSVSDYTASIDFYVQGVGFSVLYQRPTPRFAYLDLAGAQLMIEEDHAGSWITAPQDKPRGRGLNLQIEVPDVHAARKRLQAREFPPFRDIQESWYPTGEGKEEGQLEYLAQDPDGYLIRLVEVLQPE